MDTLLSEVLVFKLFRAEVTAGAVAAPAIVIAFNRCTHLFTAEQTLAVDALHFPLMKEKRPFPPVDPCPNSCDNTANFFAGEMPELYCISMKWIS